MLENTEDPEDDHWVESAHPVLRHRVNPSIYTGGAWQLPAELRDVTTIFENVDLRGGDLTEVEDADTVTACAASCRSYRGGLLHEKGERPNACKGWTLMKRSRLCFLKDGNWTRIAVEKSAGLISGIVPRG